MTKRKKGITLISLVITITLMVIISSTAVYISFDRFQINNLRKMMNDIELLQDKVSIYYLNHKMLPILRDGSGTGITYQYGSLNFRKNSADNDIYYIIDLKALDGVSLNYGKEYETSNEADDVYIINELTHIIYYVKGIEVEGNRYHFIGGADELGAETGLTDKIPPSKPQINVISGNVISVVNGYKKYDTSVEIEIVSGKDSGSGVAGTIYSLDNGSTWHRQTANKKIYEISTNGKHTILAQTYDNASTPNYSEQESLTLEIEMIIEHSFTNYIYNNDATCLEDGTKTAKCNKCDVTNTITAPGTALGHDYVEVVKPKYKKSNKTYTSPAIYYKSCSRCGAFGDGGTFTYGPLLTDSDSSTTLGNTTGNTVGNNTVGGTSSHTCGWNLKEYDRDISNAYKYDDIDKKVLGDCSSCSHRHIAIYECKICYKTKAVIQAHSPRYPDAAIDGTWFICHCGTKLTFGLFGTAGAYAPSTDGYWGNFYMINNKFSDVAWASKSIWDSFWHTYCSGDITNPYLYARSK